MTKADLISVIVPVYNGAEFLPAAIASIRAQAYDPLEIIIIDDGSTDHTAQVVQALGADLRYVYQPNQGPAAARNHGLALAQGELIAFLDADDLWPAHKLAHQVAALAADDDTQVVWGMTKIQPYAISAQPDRVDATPRLTPCLGSLLCRKAVFQRIGIFEPTLRLAEDLEWLRRLQASDLLVKRSPELALIYRLRPGSITYGKSLHELGWLALVKDLLSHRRAVPVANLPVAE